MATLSFNIWLDFFNDSIFSGLFWLTLVFFIIAFIFLYKTKFNKSVLFFCLFCLLIFYPEPYYYYYKNKIVNIRYFYQLIPIMLGVGTLGFFIITKKLRYFLEKSSFFRKIFFNFKPTVIMIMICTIICLGFSFSQLEGRGCDYLLIPIREINTEINKENTKPIYIAPKNCDQKRVSYYISTGKFIEVENNKFNPDYILELCNKLHSNKKSIFVLFRSTEEKLNYSNKFLNKFKLIKLFSSTKQGKLYYYFLYLYSPKYLGI